jgi:small subunit ribosomal protein S6
LRFGGGPPDRETRVPTYEGLFLIEPTAATKEWDKVQEDVTRIVGKADGKIVSSNKWGERKLAYPIRGHKRGTYLLAYLDVSAEAIAKIRRECELSEIILRVLLLRHEGEIKQHVAPQELPPPSETYTGGPRRERRY